MYSLSLLLYSLPIINIPCQSGTFVSVDEPTLANCRDLKSIVYITLYSWCTFYGLGQMYNGMWGLLRWFSSKESACWCRRCEFDQEYRLEQETATHSSILARKIPWTEKCGRLQFIQTQRVGHDWVSIHTHTHNDMYPSLENYTEYFHRPKDSLFSAYSSFPLNPWRSLMFFLSW